jgi:hypothetical protein
MHLAPALWDRSEILPGMADFQQRKNLGRAPVQVRFCQYQDSHREEVRRICCDTGFLGKPIDPIYQDRELFADLFTNPYLDYEPEWTLVAENAGRVVGYLTGSVNPNFNRTLMLSGFQTACKMLSRLITCKYSDHPRSEHFVRWLLARGLTEQPKHPDGAAHLHMNLERPFRWGSVARRLLAMYEDLLFATGINHYYAKFFSCPQRNPETMYGRCGFQIYDRVETTIFQTEVIDTVSVVCVHKKLDDATSRSFVPRSQDDKVGMGCKYGI